MLDRHRGPNELSGTRRGMARLVLLATLLLHPPLGIAQGASGKWTLLVELGKSVSTVVLTEAAKASMDRLLKSAPVPPNTYDRARIGELIQRSLRPDFMAGPRSIFADSVDYLGSNGATSRGSVGFLMMQHTVEISERTGKRAHAMELVAIDQLELDSDRKFVIVTYTVRCPLSERDDEEHRVVGEYVEKHAALIGSYKVNPRVHAVKVLR